MKKTLKFLFLLLSLWMPISSHAVDLNIFGLELGKPLALTECDFRKNSAYKFYTTPAKIICFEESQPTWYYKLPMRMINIPRQDSPLFVKNWRFLAMEIDGVFMGLEIKTPGIIAQDSALKSLSEKYGRPKSVTALDLQNEAGATFQSIIAKWEIDGLYVTLHGTSGRLDEGQILIDLEPAMRLREKLQADQVRPTKL